MYPSSWITVKEYPDGTRWCTVQDKNIPVQVFSGEISREAVQHAEQATEDIFTAHADDNPFCMIADLRRLKGLTGYVRQQTKSRIDSFPKHRSHYIALLMNQTLPNRLMAVFLTTLARIAGPHIAIQVFYHPEAAQLWLEGKRRAASIAS